VGLDLVRAAVRRIDGDVRVDWTPGRGTTFTIDCTPSLAMLRALLVAVGPQLLAIPSSHVERVSRIGLPDIRRAEGRDVIPTGEGPVPMIPLARLLPPLIGRQPGGSVLAVLLRAGDRRLAVAVDEVLAEQELVLRPLASAWTQSPRVSGAALLASGRVAVVLNAAALVRSGLELAPDGGPGLAATRGQEPVRRRILVVDDSITARTLEQSLLEAAGYDVRTAVDGSDGWNVLQAEGADLVVTDIEMPQLDGFRLCELIRGSRRFRELPIVLVTALESAEHRARGLECGASAYLGKSTFDRDGLLSIVRGLLGEEPG
jgi:two-component system chemotaxis sensor kinase CheA